MEEGKQNEKDTRPVIRPEYLKEQKNSKKKVNWRKQYKLDNIFNI